MRSPKYCIFLCIVTLLVTVMVTVHAAESRNNLLLNGDFSLGLDENSLPLHWTSFALLTDGVSVSLSNEYKTAGEHSLALVDATAEKSVGMRSMRVNAAAGQRFLAEVDVRIQSGDAMVYLDFHNDKGQRVDAKILTIRGPIEWQTVSVEGIAPEGTVDVSIILYSGLVNQGTSYFDNVRLYLLP
ncbi:MAG: hypothetical protein ACOX44_00465 [Limnochordia bacterium]